MEFKIRDRFKDLINPPTDEERKILEQSILKEGVRDPLVIWKEENVLIDGHTRYGICQEHDVEFDVKHLSFPDEDHVVLWMTTNQLGRRNLTTGQAGYLIGIRYDAEKKIHGSNQHKTENAGSVKITNPTGVTSERLAKEYGIAEKTVRNNEDYAKAVDAVSALHDRPTRVKHAILSGKIKISKKALKEIGEIAEGGDTEYAKELFKEEAAPKKRAPKAQPKETPREETPKSSKPKSSKPKTPNSKQTVLQ